MDYVVRYQVKARTPDGIKREAYRVADSYVHDGDGWYWLELTVNGVSPEGYKTAGAHQNPTDWVADVSLRLIEATPES